MGKKTTKNIPARDNASLNKCPTMRTYSINLNCFSGAVNTITFCDDNRRFVSTSDDKSMRVWEWDIPVDMKYIGRYQCKRRLDSGINFYLLLFSRQ